MAETALLEDFIHGEHRLLGKRLRPYCLWHRLLLEALEHPIITGAPLEPGHLVTAVGVLRTRFGHSDTRKPWIGPWRAYRLATGGFEKEMEKLRAYLSDFFRKPEYAFVAQPTPKGGTTPQKITPPPETFRVAADVIGWSHWPEAYVWEMPIGAALWYQASALQQRGITLDFLDDQQRGWQEEAREQLRKQEETKQNGS